MAIQSASFITVFNVWRCGCRNLSTTASWDYRRNFRWTYGFDVIKWNPRYVKINKVGNKVFYNAVLHTEFPRAFLKIYEGYLLRQHFNKTHNVLQTELLDFWTFSIVRYSRKHKHDVSEIGSVSVLRWKGEKTPTQLGPLERANLNHWIKGPNSVGVFFPFTWGRKHPLSETSCFYSLEYRTMEKVQKPSNSVCYRPPSEPFRINTMY
jgi:hypothetical protein